MIGINPLEIIWHHDEMAKLIKMDGEDQYREYESKYLLESLDEAIERAKKYI